MRWLASCPESICTKYNFRVVILWISSQQHHLDSVPASPVIPTCGSWVRLRRFSISALSFRFRITRLSISNAETTKVRPISINNGEGYHAYPIWKPVRRRLPCSSGVRWTRGLGFMTMVFNLHSNRFYCNFYTWKWYLWILDCEFRVVLLLLLSLSLLGDVVMDGCVRLRDVGQRRHNSSLETYDRLNAQSMIRQIM